jgi:D-alanyl-D-alanine carboxypeptidase
MMKSVKAALFGLWVGVSAFLPTTAAQAASDVALPVLERYLEKQGLAGGVLLISAPHLRQVAVSGVADRRRDTPVQADTRFYIASIGKMAVAVAALQLVEEGKLGLDDKVAPLVGGVPDIAKLANVRSARLKHLLDHTSGIPDYLSDDFYKTFRAEPQRLTPALALPFAYDESATGRPGQRYEYCNSNYVLLGDIIATADRSTIEDVLQRRVLDPAGMRGTTVGADPRDKRLAHGYADIKGKGKEQDVSLLSWNSLLGDGPLVTTAEDLERFLFALFRDGKLLPRAAVARMTTPSDKTDEYGFGVELGSDRWGEWFGHTGREDGFEAEIRYYPARRAALVFMTNGNAESDKSILDRAAAALFRNTDDK